MARAVPFDRYGDRDVLYIADVAVPEPAAGEDVVERPARDRPVDLDDERSRAGHATKRSDEAP